MNRRFLRAAITLLVVVLSSAACRQADGPMPPTMPDTTNRVSDMSRDLLSIANGDPSGERDFREDLQGFAATAEGRKAAADLARRFSTVLPGKMLSEQAAQQLAQSAWVVIAGSQLSERQVEDLVADVRTQLETIGVRDPELQATLADLTAAQAAINQRPRRWYEI